MTLEEDDWGRREGMVKEICRAAGHSGHLEAKEIEFENQGHQQW